MFCLRLHCFYQIHTHTHTHTRAHTHTHTRTHTHTHTHTHKYTHMCMYIYIYIYSQLYLFKFKSFFSSKIRIRCKIDKFKTSRQNFKNIRCENYVLLTSYVQVCVYSD